MSGSEPWTGQGEGIIKQHCNCNAKGGVLRVNGAWGDDDGPANDFPAIEFVSAVLAPKISCAWGNYPLSPVTVPPSLKNLNLMTRAEWGARDTRSTEYMATPVSIVFIHHTAMSRCQDHESCCQEVRRIQNFHMDDRGWDDIAYNYLIGENGYVYEARGWNRVGAHTAGWNNVAIGLSLMGDFTSVEPDPRALDAIRNLLELGVAEGKISANYKLYGHRDARNTTECPGQKLYDIIIKWEHYDSNPPICPN